jgi:hypothetical protein
MGVTLMFIWSWVIMVALVSFSILLVVDETKIEKLEKKIKEVDVTYDYKVITSSNGNVIDITQPLTLVGAVKKLMEKLDVCNAIDCVDDGKFILTVTPVTNEVRVKRFCVTVGIPSTTFTIKKINSGSIDKEEFMAVVKYIKESYNERV